MSFYENKKDRDFPRDQENHGGTLVVVGGLAICAILPKLWVRFLDFHRTHFSEIYFSIFLLGIAFVVYRIFSLRKKHKLLIEKISKIKSLYLNWEGGVRVGKAEGVPVVLPDRMRLEHVQIVGATGRGKTKSVIVPWMVSDFECGKRVVLIDGKGDLSLRDDLFARIGKSWKEVIHFNMDDELALSTTNPLKYGSPQQITDRIFSSFEFEDPFYRGLQYDVCLKIVRLIHEIADEVTFRDLHECIVNDDALLGFVKRSKNEQLCRELGAFVNQPQKDRTQNLMGLTTQISPFATGELAHLVNGEVEGKEFMSISEILLKDPWYRMVLISLPTLSYQSAGKALGRMLLQELAWAVGERQQGAEKDFVSVFLDEFSSFAYEEFVQILNKARSAGVAIHLSHQSMGDLWSVSREFGDIVNTNTNVKMLLGLNDPTAADYFASHIGTRTTEKRTERAEARGLFGKRIERLGDFSIREVEEFIVHPNTLKSLAPGEGVLVTRTPEGTLATRVEFSKLQGGL